MTIYPSNTGGGAQLFAVVRDDSDNIYVIGPHKDGDNIIGATAYAKGVGHTWTKKTTFSASLPSYTEGELNQFAAAWHNVGTNGTIMVVASHTAGRTPNTTGDIVYALLDCERLLGNSSPTGSMLRNSGGARGTVVSSTTDSGYYTSYANETGSGLDVVAAPDTSDRGYVLTHRPSSGLGDNIQSAAFRYVLTSGGTSISDSDSTTVGWAEKDASSKVRLVGISGTEFAAVTVDDDAGVGLTVRFYQNSGTSASFTSLGQVLLDGEGLTTLPSAATMATSQAWDALYDPGAEKLYIYYTDTADNNRLMRTSIDVNTHLATGEETQVSAAIGAAGSTTYALRVHRTETNGQQALVSVASKTSGGTHSTIYVTNTLNQAPNAPTLAVKSNYDATGAATFSWTFSDPNAGDTQSAYQLQIVDVSDGSVDVDTGKVTSTTSSRNVTGGTLTNGKSYQWRVLTYDSEDAVGPYSSYGTFSTSAGGTVTITDPASDNPAGVDTDNYTIAWSASGTTQAAYRVVVTRTDTAATLVNTGWVTSIATAYEIVGMLTGVEYQVAVTVRNGALVESGTGTRLITPDYDNVPDPVISAAASDDGSYITLSVANGAPSGDNPAATYNLIMRRRAGTTDDFVPVASIDPDGSYKDYAVASGVAYEYKARAVA